MTSNSDSDKRVSQAVIGVTLLIAIGLIVSTVLIGYHYLPGIWGEWIGSMVGIMTTPFFLEVSFILIGFTIVLLINGYRRNKDGDELVYLDSNESDEKPSVIDGEER